MEGQIGIEAKISFHSSRVSYGTDQQAIWLYMHKQNESLPRWSLITPH